MKTYGRILAIILLSGVTAYGLLRLGNIDISYDTLAKLNKNWLALAFFTFYISVLARGFRWQRILKAMGWSVGLVYAQTLLIAGLFISAIIPARAGDIGRVAMLKQDHQIPIAQGIASIATERALDVFSILSLAIVGAVWALQGRIPSEIFNLIIGTAILFLIGLVGLFTIPKFEQWLRNPKWLKDRVPQKLWDIYHKVLDFGFDLIHSVRAIAHKPITLITITGESLLIWFYDALIIYSILKSLEVSTTISESTFMAMTSDLTAAVPITPGALGQYDAALVAIAALFGIATSQASLLALILRFTNFWTFLLVSGVTTYVFGFSRALTFQANEAEETPQTLTIPSNPTTTEH
ncbi:MAG: lysylphosphatidylglycerol synthase transmembrane domain-containing protein [Chloroflexota bacterium]